ncbi:TPA: Lrp/AsnC family transcriptional regulator [Candidatus Woesearchaeota archaeon]|nr:Lrp/AsnC family transcriptional regulator [Candidatus Woesearchaeota archaeon]
MYVLVQEGSPVALDVKDKRILLALSENARKPYTDIARKVGLSPEGVKYRIARLREQNVLLGARTVISFSRLGLTSYHIFLSMHPPDAKTETALVRFLQSRHEVNAVLQYLGKWDYEIAVATRTPQEFDDFRSALMQEFPRAQDEQFSMIIAPVAGTSLPARIFPGIGKDRIGRTEECKEPFALDEVDTRLLMAIGENADSSILDIMAHTKLSRDQVSYRMRRLQDEGVIVEFRPIINYGALGYSMHAVLLRLQARDAKRERTLASYLRNHAAVIWAARTIGSLDMIIYIISKNPSDFHTSIGDLRVRFGDLIKSYETLIAYKEHKYTWRASGDTHSIAHNKK